MSRRLFNFCVVLAAVFCVARFAGSTNADVVLNFTPSLTGGVIVAGTGSGQSTATTTTSDFDSQDYNSDYLLDTFTASITPADTVSGMLTNVTTGISEVVVGFRVDRDSTSGDDIDFQTANAMTFSTGDEFSLTIDATFDVGTLPFSQLIVGTHTEDGGEFADENFGQYTVNVVPEPNTLAVAWLAAIGLVGLRCRRPGKRA